jgi:hypothetical protein
MIEFDTRRDIGGHASFVGTVAIRNNSPAQFGHLRCLMAGIVSFIRNSWGNDAKPIEAPKVVALRSSAAFD